MDMERQWELAGGGTLCCQEVGERVVLRADCPADGAGLYKVWLHSGGNGRFLLGTLAPEGGRLCLRRTVTRAELERRHCWPVTGGERVLAFAFSGQAGPWQPWRGEHLPTKDPVLRSCLTAGPGLLFRRMGEGFQMAQFLDDGRPLALAPLFCMAWGGQEQGHPLLIWSFDSQGWPVINRH